MLTARPSEAATTTVTYVATTTFPTQELVKLDLYSVTIMLNVVRMLTKYIRQDRPAESTAPPTGLDSSFPASVYDVGWPDE